MMPLDFVAEVTWRRRVLRQLKGVADDAVASAPREYGLLQRELLLGALEKTPADIGVFAFVILAHHAEIDLPRREIPDGRLDAREANAPGEYWRTAGIRGEWE